MTLDELRNLDPKRAAGILSRAALELESGGANPAARPIDQQEASLRLKLIEELTHFISKGAEVTGPTLREKIIGALDKEVDKLLPPRDETAALERLSIDAVLPSDAYKVSFSESVPEILRKLPVDDRNLVKEVIRVPDLQEDFGPTLTPTEPSPVSLFGKWFNFGRGRDRFLLIVAASREKGQNLMVHYFLRVYSSDINLRGAKNLADVFERFSQYYGVEFNVDGWRGRFLRYLYLSSSNFRVTVATGHTEKPGRTITWSMFARHPNKLSTELAFGLGIDVNKYAKDLSKHMKFEGSHRQP
jgi:hypothetical protein